MRRLGAQCAAEVTMTMRQGESMLVALGIPVLLLVFFSEVKVLPTGSRPVDFLTPGILALAVMSSAMVSLGISTGFERSYGVLKRLGSTPLTRTELVGAKASAVVAIETIQIAALVVVGLALGWRPGGGVGGAAVVLGAVLAGTAAFAGIGLFLAGNLSGLTNLAGTNGLYLVLLLLGGMVVPLAKLPGPLQAIAQVLPAAALSQLLHGALSSGPTFRLGSGLILLAWAIVAPVIAAATFSWE
ncbi:MAG: ABC transporter permease [Acidimicrobiales bacterium]